MKFIKGWIGEKITTFNMWLSLPKNIYTRYHNIILPSKNGTSQIDHLIISIYGLFIVETKNKTGWIFGSENQDNWTQSIYGNKFSFQNPLKQTYRQKIVVSEFLNLDKSKIHTVVYFVGDCSFQTVMPENVINHNICACIKSYNNIILTIDEVNLIVYTLNQYLSNSSLTTKDHIKSLNIRHASNTICPNCGAQLIERIAKQGSNSGIRFLGCQNYPKCKFTKRLY